MKLRIWLASAAVLGLLVAAWLTLGSNTDPTLDTVAAAQTVADPASEFYYYSEGKAIPLTLRTDRIAVSFYKEVPEAAQADLLQREEALAPEEDWVLANEPRNISLVGVKNTESDTAILATLDNLRAARDVYWASPLLDAAPGFSHVMSNDFYVSVPIETPAEEILALNKEMAVDLLRVVSLPLTGRTGYWLRVTKDSPYDSLQMSNLYYEEGNFKAFGAHPRFGYLYPLLADTPDDPYYDATSNPPGQHNLETIGMPDAWDIATGNPAITVAVADSGVDMDYTDIDSQWVGHPDLNANQWTNEVERNGTADVDDDGNGWVDDFYGWNFVPLLPPDYFSENLPMDDYYHGTKSAGVVGAVTNNDLGVAGIAGGWDGEPDGIKIMPLRVADNRHNTGYEPEGEEDVPVEPVDFCDLADALEYARINGAHVVTMSLGNLDDPCALLDQIYEARNADVVLVAAAHNYDENVVRRPAAYPGVICVGATNKCDPPQRKYGSESGVAEGECNDTFGGPGIEVWGSDWGWELDIMAPGMRYWSTDIHGDEGSAPNDPAFPTEDDYHPYARTSSATPQPAGVAALMQSAMVDRGWPLLSAVQVQATMQFTADDMIYTRTNVPTGHAYEVAVAGRDIYTGYGMLNAAAAMERAVAPTPFILRDSNGRHMMSIDEAGNLILEGEVLKQRTETQITAEVSKGAAAFTVTDDAGVVQIFIDEEKETHLGTGLKGQNLYLRGDLTAEQSTLTPPSNGLSSFVVRNPSDEIIAYFDTSGNVYLKGRVFEGSDPDPNA